MFKVINVYNFCMSNSLNKATNNNLSSQALIVQNFLTLSVVPLILDKFNPKLSSMTVLKNIFLMQLQIKSGFIYRNSFISDAIVILTPVQILTPAG